MLEGEGLWIFRAHHNYYRLVTLSTLVPTSRFAFSSDVAFSAASALDSVRNTRVSEAACWGGGAEPLPFEGGGVAAPPYPYDDAPAAAAVGNPRPMATPCCCCCCCCEVAAAAVVAAMVAAAMPICRSSRVSNSYILESRTRETALTL